MHKKGAPWLPEEVDELYRQHESGKGYKQLAADNHVSVARIGQVLEQRQKRKLAAKRDLVVKLKDKSTKRGPRPKISVEEVISLHHQGLTDQQIADEKRLSVAYVSRLRCRGGIKIKPPRKITPQDVISFSRQGLTDQQIAEKEGLSYLYIRKLRFIAEKPEREQKRIK